MLPDRLSKLLTAYVDGELNSRQRRTVVRLLQRSPEARRLFKRLKGDSMILRALPRRKLQMDLSGSVLLTINARNIQLRPEACPPLPPKRKAQPWKKWLALGGVAAAVLLAIGAGSYFFFAGMGDPTAVESTDTEKKSTRHANGPESSLPDSPIAVVHDVDPMLTTPAPSTPERVKRPQQELLGMLTPKQQAYQVAAPRLVRVLRPRELDQPIASHQLQQELQSAGTFRLDLFSTDSATAMERLQAALKARGINLKLDAPAQNSLGRRAKATYAVYAEELTAGDLLQVLNQLGAEDRKKPVLDRMVVNALTPTDVARAVGGEPALYPPPPDRQGPLGVDLTKPVSEGTGSQIVKSLATPRTDQPSLTAGDRQALALVYSPPVGDRFPTLSKDGKSFVDGRNSHYREGAVQVLITIWNQ